MSRLCNSYLLLAYICATVFVGTSLTSSADHLIVCATLLSKSLYLLLSLSFIFNGVIFVILEANDYLKESLFVFFFSVKVLK